jgi:hypothetical protein
MGVEATMVWQRDGVYRGQLLWVHKAHVRGVANTGPYEMGKGEDMCKKWGYGTDAERIDVDGYKVRKSLRREENRE